MKKSNYYVLIGFILFLVYGVYYDLHSRNLLTNYGRYTIGTIEKIDGGGRGCALSIYVSFVYKNIKYTENGCAELDEVKKSFIGKHFFVKIVPNNIDRAFNIKYSCPVPDSITVAPSEGWSEEWMQEHFPDCVMDTASK
jgi:hypothetical protein